MKSCVYAGTFDPPTIGHKDIIDKALKLFDSVIVAVMVNPDKTPYLTVEERTTLLKKLYSKDDRVKVIYSDKAVVDILKEQNTPYYVRGLRTASDFEYETQNYFASKKLDKKFNMVYFPSEQENLHISSSMLKSHIKFNKDYSHYIPPEIYQDLKNIINNKKI